MHMRIGSNDQHTTRHDTGDERVTFEDEFDRLLDQSSLGASNARALQAMTPDVVLERVQEQVDAKDGELFLNEPEADLDVDDVLLDLVRQATSAPSGPRPGCAHALLATWPQTLATPPPCSPPTGVSYLGGFGAGKSLFLGVLAHLAAANVFDYVRRDIARSIVDIAFTTYSTTNAAHCRSVLVLVVNSAAARSGVADEVIDKLLPAAHGRPRIETGSGEICGSRPFLISRESWWHHLLPLCMPVQINHTERLLPRRPPHKSIGTCETNERDSSTPQNSWWERQVPPRWPDRPRMRSVGVGFNDRWDWLDDLVESIELFAARVSGRVSPVQADRGGASEPYSFRLSFVEASLLGLLHEGPQSVRILLSGVHGRLGRADMTSSRLRRSLQSLQERGLIQPTLIARVPHSRTRFQLTKPGQRTFRRWLLDEPDRKRGEVVLNLLNTAPFTPWQRNALLALSTSLELDDGQVVALRAWATGVRSSGSCDQRTSREILMNLIEPGPR